MEIHKLLARQLKHSSLSETIMPQNIEVWQDFLQRISNLYKETDEERYLLERSMDLSSHEIMELNKKLENAQEIAELGYWNYDTLTGKMNWSKQLRRMVGLSSSDHVPNYSEFISSVHPEHRNKLNQCIKNAITKGDKYEIELLVRIADGSYRWHYAIGAPFHGSEPPYTELSGIAMDITKRKEAEETLSKLNSQIISSAREVGMADVAVSILHNVGNVLNSVNVSSNLLVENLEKSHFNRFFDVCSMLRSNRDNVVEYLSSDPKGKLIPEFLINLADAMQENYKISCSEVANINEKIQHIRDIVMAQQALSRVNGIFEKINLRDIMKATVMMIGSQLSEKGVSLIEDYQYVPDIYIDRSKLIQILVNLVQNAKDALLEDTTGKTDKHIKITIEQLENNKDVVRIIVKDNGIGISKENINKIFSYGFSTKRNGHGIGLHSSALSVKELGGKLTMESDGIGQGARFILELPIHKQPLNEENQHGTN